MGAAESTTTETIGRYEVVGRLAVGGMAEILLGRLRGPSGFERAVVIKRILPHLAEQPAFVDMFLDEARLAARIQHRNVVQVHELGQDGVNLFLTMEYLEGENTAGIVRRSLVKEEELGVAVCAYIVAEACAGLHAAHELTDAEGRPLGLVHRDVSPQNIFVTYGGGVRVLDFGIAKAADRSAHTEVGQLKGKFEYMSPEQCRGKAIDRRCDVFALGIVLYELLTRRRLFKRDNKLAVLEAVCREMPLAPSKVIEGCPESLDRVVMKALSKHADDRYPTAAELRRDLMAVVRELMGTNDPEEELVAVMRRLFGDRIAEKNEMLRCVRAGDAVGVVPNAEADSAVEIPELEGMEPSSELSGMNSIPRARLESGFTLGGVHAGSGVDALAAEAARLKRKKLTTLVAGGGAGLMLLILLLVWLSAPEPNGVFLTQGTFALRVPRSAMPRRGPPLPPAVTEVVIKVISEPDGAAVLVAGEDRGKTPIEFKLARGTDPVEITLRRDGYLDAVEKVMPDENQRFRVSLTKAKVKTGGGPVPKTGGGFHRFD
ncbi:MAG: serine/threonine protein kinase [Myxococcales bacterium]|nr:serine/threonine protein kinase [Myxococcales bacterium]